jgi:hypothetical protein
LQLPYYSRLSSLIHAEETALQANVLLATAEPLKLCKILLLGVPNTHGIKLAANALFHMKVEEIPMLLTTTQMDQLMLDFGKSIP